jgi:hypothetical protein
VRFKVVPPAPGDLGHVHAAYTAMPLVPNAEESCCARLMARTTVHAQDEAKEWLTFLRALGLVAEGPRGYRRVRDVDDDPDTLADRFRERVFAAEEALTVLEAADEPLTAEAVFERLRERVPTWERQRSSDWAEVWQERVARILAWAVLFHLAAREGDGYVRL